MARASSVFHAAALLIGAVGLAVILDRLGLANLRGAIVEVGPYFALIALVDICSAACDAFALHSFLAPNRPPYWRVYFAQLSGMAINRLTPGHSLGEGVKATLLARIAPTDAAVAAVLSFNVFTIFFAVVVMIIGVPITMLSIDLEPNVRLVVWIGTGVLVSFAVVLLLLLRRGIVATLIGVLATLRLISAERAARWRERTAPIDHRLRGLQDGTTPGLVRGAAGTLASRMVAWIGTVTILYAANIPMSVPVVVATLSVGILVSWVSNIVPLGLGLADATNFALYGLLGATPAAGLVFTMVNRMRTIVIASIGLVVYTLVTLFHRRDAQ